MEKNFYGNLLPKLELLDKTFTSEIDYYRNTGKAKDEIDPIEHFKHRIKSEKSLKEKLERRHLPITLESAMAELTDIVGFRIVCTFIHEIYAIADYFKNHTGLHLLIEKDYVKYPKENGYRSLHLIFEYTDGVLAHIPFELQIRTVSMDCWASLEHQLKYKHQIKDPELIVTELKRCASIMASIDINLQTIYQIIKENDA